MNGTFRVRSTFLPFASFSAIYDPNNRLSSLRINNDQPFSITRDALGRKTDITYPNYISVAYAYDPNSRTTSITSGDLQLAYQYDQIGNRTTATTPFNPGEINQYTYDSTNQLTAATHTSQPNEQYVYDLLGNRTNTTVNSANQVTDDGNYYTYTYDANGNLATRTTIATGEVRTFTWDSENRLVGIEEIDGVRAEYKYDPFGRRIQTNYYGGITWYVYDGPNIITEYDDYNESFSSFVHGDEIDQPLSWLPNYATDRYYYHADALGSIIALTNSDASLVQVINYDSFGNRLFPEEDPWFEHLYGFAGRELDPDTGLYNNRARYYDTLTGRFISKDPIGFKGGINLYAYTKNNPVNYTDPFGLLRDCDQEQIDCFRRCWNQNPPWPITRGSGGHYRYCQSKCLAEYMECKAENACKEAAKYCSDNPMTCVAIGLGTALIITQPELGLVLAPL